METLNNLQATTGVTALLGGVVLGVSPGIAALVDPGLMCRGDEEFVWFQLAAFLSLFIGAMYILAIQTENLDFVNASIVGRKIFMGVSVVLVVMGWSTVTLLGVSLFDFSCAILSSRQQEKAKKQRRDIRVKRMKGMKEFEKYNMVQLETRLKAIQSREVIIVRVQAVVMIVLAVLGIIAGKQVFVEGFGFPECSSGGSMSMWTAILLIFLNGWYWWGFVAHKPLRKLDFGVFGAQVVVMTIWSALKYRSVAEPSIVLTAFTLIQGGMCAMMIAYFPLENAVGLSEEEFDKMMKKEK